MAGHEVLLCQLRKDLHDLDAAERRLILKAFEKQLEKLVLRLLVYLSSLKRFLGLRRLLFRLVELT